MKIKHTKKIRKEESSPRKPEYRGRPSKPSMPQSSDPCLPSLEEILAKPHLLHQFPEFSRLLIISLWLRFHEKEVVTNERTSTNYPIKSLPEFINDKKRYTFWTFLVTVVKWTSELVGFSYQFSKLLEETCFFFTLNLNGRMALEAVKKKKSLKEILRGMSDPFLVENIVECIEGWYKVFLKLN